MTHDQLTALLKPETAQIDQAMRDDLATVANARLHEVLTYAIFNGGKRVRPLLTVLTARLCHHSQGRQETPGRIADLYRLALTFEYLHVASLLHDDVIDQSEKRRGRETANRVWDNTHVILAGDYLHARATLLAGTLGGLECLSIVSEAAAAMVESEFIQLENAAERNTSLDRYFQVLRGKTAALIAAAAASGIVFAQGGNEERRAVHTFAFNLGLTFQIVDDLLDYLGDPEITGKAVGNDFRERKMTLPLIYALETAKAQDRTALLGLLDKGAADSTADFAAVRDAIAKVGGFAKARDTAESLIREATSALSLFPPGPERDVLTALAQYVLQRQK